MEQTQVSFEDMLRFSNQFQQECEEINQLRTRTRWMVDELIGGGWQGKGADRFFDEMVEVIIPAMQRLSDSLGEAAQCANQIVAFYRRAQEEAGQGFREIRR